MKWFHLGVLRHRITLEQRMINVKTLVAFTRQGCSCGKTWDIHD